VCAMLLCLNPPPSCAQSTNGWSPLPEGFSADDLFASGRYEAGLTTGVLLSPVASQQNRPEINYVTTGVQLGRMFGGVRGSGVLRGSFEAAAEAFGNAIYEGPGSYIAGVTVWLRYNFVPRGWRLIPYIQGGAGLLSTDIDRGLVGQPFNFNLDAGAGVRYLIGRQWSVGLEYRFQHISNANLGKRNVGINSQGPILGLSYFF
jgi:opacity protein-like surface antigen